MEEIKADKIDVNYRAEVRWQSRDQQQLIQILISSNYDFHLFGQVPSIAGALMKSKDPSLDFKADQSRSSEIAKGRVEIARPTVTRSDIRRSRVRRLSWSVIVISTAGTHLTLKTQWQQRVSDDPFNMASSKSWQG